MEEKKDYRKELFYEKKNGYDSVDAAAREAMEAYCEGYKAYPGRLARPSARP